VVLCRRYFASTRCLQERRRVAPRAPLFGVNAECDEKFLLDAECVASVVVIVSVYEAAGDFSVLWSLWRMLDIVPGVQCSWHASNFCVQKILHCVNNINGYARWFYLCTSRVFSILEINASNEKTISSQNKESNL
jgi:hypothetical protein